MELHLKQQFTLVEHLYVLACVCPAGVFFFLAGRVVLSQFAIGWTSKITTGEHNSPGTFTAQLMKVLLLLMSPGWSHLIVLLRSSCSVQLPEVPHTYLVRGQGEAHVHHVMTTSV